jgi:hypothetical protein
MAARAIGGREDHWDQVYRDRQDAALTWFEEVPSLSLRLVAETAAPSDAIIDVGGGASRLVDALLEAGFGDITVLDLSAEAIAVSRARLGPRAEDVAWIVADMTTWTPDRTYRVWHDRAAFHFLTTDIERDAYITRMADAVVSGGSAILSTFAEDGPEMCSGLAVARYAPRDLERRIEACAPGAFRAVASTRWTHVTPKGREQRFQYSVLRRR